MTQQAIVTAYLTEAKHCLNMGRYSDALGFLLNALPLTRGPQWSKVMLAIRHTRRAMRITIPIG